jgi:putative FmdB family regulatory protein
MPTYEYVCDECQYQFEVFQSILDSPKRKCPSCGRYKLRRLIGTGGGIIFRGSGFYATDYRGSSYKKAAEAERKQSASSEGSGSSESSS